MGGVDSGPGSCRRLYRAVVTESDTQVEVQLQEQFIAGPDDVGCIDLAQSWHSDVRLAAPLGERTVSGQAGADLFVVSEEHLADPAFVPDGYTMQRSYPEGDSWIRSWRLEKAKTTPCTPSTYAVDVVQAKGPDFDFASLTVGLTQGGDVSGALGVGSRWVSDDGSTITIIWPTSPWVVAVRQVPLCGGDVPLDDASMTGVAGGLHLAP